LLVVIQMKYLDFLFHKQMKIISVIKEGDEHYEKIGIQDRLNSEIERFNSRSRKSKFL
jgi:hypothetical protein